MNLMPLWFAVAFFVFFFSLRLFALLKKDFQSNVIPQPGSTNNFVNNHGYCKFVLLKKIPMTSAIIRQKLYEYIRFAEDKKVKAFYTIVADEANETNEWWEDKKLLDMVKNTDADMESGKDKGISWSEAREQLLQRGRK